MAKTSKNISQKEKASSSQSTADKTPVEPRPKKCVPGACVLTSDFKVNKGSPVPGRFEPVSRYMCSIIEEHLEQIRKDCNWENKEVVIPSPEEDITTHVKGFLGLGKDAVLRALSGDEEASAFIPKPVKDNKRKRASTSEDPKSKMRTVRKPRKNTIPLTEESVRRLRDEDEEEEDDGSVLVARVKKTIEASKEARSMVATAVHRESCSRSRSELRQYEADLRRVMEERNALRLLFGQREEEIKDLRAELAKAYQDQADLTEQMLEVIGKLCEEVDMIRAETLGWKDGMDRLAAEKKTARAQLSSTENQLQVMKEKSLVQVRKIEELEARLASELAKAKFDAKQAKANADAFVAVYRADAEAAQVQAREVAETAKTRAHWVAELAKFQSRRETLEEIHARGFDLTEEIKRA
ncbi:uncharacterized protein [Nicotiana tomentosiformis]|uniref:uncharacterized protein n=1 Tax=Nicotiana tomentosiformis TaxID=4098 RepID=UPI00388C41EC